MVTKQSLLYRILLQQNLETKRLKCNAITNEMLAHGLDPVQPERMQHGTCSLHDTQNGDSSCEPEVEDDDHDDGSLDASEGEGILHGHFPEDNGETLMGEGERPETEVRCSVGDAVETEF